MMGNTTAQTATATRTPLVPMGSAHAERGSFQAEAESRPPCAGLRAAGGTDRHAGLADWRDAHDLETVGGVTRAEAGHPA
jgi:hypothetical protein